MNFVIYNFLMSRNVQRDFIKLSQEPEGPVRAEVIDNRLFALVKNAVEKELISMSKAAKFLIKL